MEKTIRPILTRWFLFNSLVGSFAYFMLSIGSEGDILLLVFGIFFLGLLLYGMLFIRPPKIILKDSSFVLKVFFFRKELQYSAIKGISISKVEMPMGRAITPILHGTNILSPKLFYYFIAVTIIVVFLVVLSKESFSEALSLSSFLAIVLITVAVTYHFMMFKISTFTHKEVSLYIHVDAKHYNNFPFSHYKKYPFHFRLNLPFLDLTKKRYCELISTLKTKLDSEVFHQSVDEYEKLSNQ